MKKVKLDFSKQSARMRESIREEMEIWEKSITQKYGIVIPKKKKEAK